MKHKDLYNYIKTEIINELIEGKAEDDAATAAALKNQQAQIAAATAASAAADAAKKAADKKKAETTSDQKPGLTEDGLNEMGRKGKGYKPGANLSKAKQVYTASKLAQILELIENAGEDGITAKEIQAATGIKNLPQLYPLLGQLAAIGAIIDPKVTTGVSEPGIEEPETTEPEMTDKDEDEIEIEKDEYEQPEEEEDIEIEVEPSAADLKAAEKITGTPSGKEAEINTVVSKIKTIAGKIENLEGSEYDIKLKALKQFVANNKGLLKGVDLNSITNGLIS
jgi:hypothetical protein